MITKKINVKKVDSGDNPVYRFMDTNNRTVNPEQFYNDYYKTILNRELVDYEEYELSIIGYSPMCGEFYINDSIKLEQYLITKICVEGGSHYNTKKISNLLNILPKIINLFNIKYLYELDGIVEHYIENNLNLDSSVVYNFLNEYNYLELDEDVFLSLKVGRKYDNVPGYLNYIGFEFEQIFSQVEYDLDIELRHFIQFSFRLVISDVYNILKTRTQIDLNHNKMQLWGAISFPITMILHKCIEGKLPKPLLNAIFDSLIVNIDSYLDRKLYMN